VGFAGTFITKTGPCHHRDLTWRGRYGNLTPEEGKKHRRPRTVCAVSGLRRRLPSRNGPGSASRSWHLSPATERATEHAACWASRRPHSCGSACAASPPAPANAGRQNQKTLGLERDYRSPGLGEDRRPVTPEVAGSSPVAPAKVPATQHLFRASTAGHSRIPRESRTRVGRESPHDAGR